MGNVAKTVGMLAVLMGMVACGGAERGLCDRVIKCAGGNDKDMDACVARYQGIGNQADVYNCSDSWSKLLSCYDGKLVCKDRVLSGDCSAEDKAFEACMNAASK